MLEQPSDPPTGGPPSSLRVAMRLMWAGALLTVLSIGVTFLGADDIRREVVEVADESLSAGERDRVVALTLTFLGLVGVLVAALWIWMATANGEGRRWARRTATGFGLSYLVVEGVRLAGGHRSLAQAAISVATGVLVVAILYLLYRPESSRYYDARSVPPAPPP